MVYIFNMEKKRLANGYNEGRHGKEVVQVSSPIFDEMIIHSQRWGTMRKKQMLGAGMVMDIKSLILDMRSLSENFTPQ